MEPTIFGQFLAGAISSLGGIRIVMCVLQLMASGAVVWVAFFR